MKLGPGYGYNVGTCMYMYMNQHLIRMCNFRVEGNTFELVLYEGEEEG